MLSVTANAVLSRREMWLKAVNPAPSPQFQTALKAASLTTQGLFGNLTPEVVQQVREGLTHGDNNTHCDTLILMLPLTMLQEKTRRKDDAVLALITSKAKAAPHKEGKDSQPYRGQPKQQQQQQQKSAPKQQKE